MIIKKRYTNLTTNKKERPQETEVIDNTKEKEETKQIENKPPKEKEEKKEKEKNNTEEKEKNREKEDKKTELELELDLELDLDKIQIDQREERREGTRRRGYRRVQDRNIISRAQEDAKSIKDIAKEEGYKEGIEKSKEDIEKIQKKLAEFYRYKEEIYEKVSECIYDISMEIAKKIIKKEIESDKKAEIEIIKKAVEEVNKTENKIIIKVMPQDVEIVRANVSEIFAESGVEATITVIAERGIKEGGAIIETTNGIIDATIETQLAIIEKALCKEKGE